MCDKVSIIIPTYNVEKYLHRCIDSTIKQTYDNLEIVIIDDGSIDNTRQIIQLFADKDKRIKFFFQPNKGVSSARNKALSIVDGDYIIFLDSDDWLELDCIECLLKLKNKYNNYFVCVDRYFAYFDENNNIYKKRQRLEKKVEIVSQLESLANTGTGKFNLQSSCYKLFNRSIIENRKLRFREDIHHGEDGLFVFEYLLNINGIVFSTKPLWNILERPGSATNSPYNTSWLTMIDSVNEMLEIAPDNLNVKRALYTYKIQRISIVARALLAMHKIDFSDYSYIKSECNNIVNSGYLKKIKLKYSLKVMLLLYLPFQIKKWIYKVL